MNELIKITEQKGIQLVDARELHRKLKVQTKFTNWFPRRVEEYKFDEGKDYFTENQLLPKNGQKVFHRPRTEYFLTIDMAKEIAMVERTEVGKMIRNYFIEMEKIALQTIIKMPKSLNVYGMEALPYVEWLLLHNYTVLLLNKNMDVIGREIITTLLGIVVKREKILYNRAVKYQR